MIVLVIAHTGITAYEGRLRTGTGPTSEMLPGTPVCYGTSVKEIVDEAKRHVKPSVVRRHRGIRIDIRDDPFQ